MKPTIEIPNIKIDEIKNVSYVFNKKKKKFERRVITFSAYYKFNKIEEPKEEIHEI